MSVEDSFQGPRWQLAPLNSTKRRSGEFTEVCEHISQCGSGPILILTYFQNQ